jgi:hypothetical protein
LGSLGTNRETAERAKEYADFVGLWPTWVLARRTKPDDETVDVLAE